MNTDKNNWYSSVAIRVHPWPIWDLSEGALYQLPASMLKGKLKHAPPSSALGGASCVGTRKIRQDHRPMPLALPNRRVRIHWWGGPPGGRPLGHGTPPSRCPVEESSSSVTQQAGQGAGRGRGRPPHQASDPAELCKFLFCLASSAENGPSEQSATPWIAPQPGQGG